MLILYLYPGSLIQSLDQGVNRGVILSVIRTLQCRIAAVRSVLSGDRRPPSIAHHAAGKDATIFVARKDAVLLKLAKRCLDLLNRVAGQASKHPCVRRLAVHEHIADRLCVRSQAQHVHPHTARRR